MMVSVVMTVAFFIVMMLMVVAMTLLAVVMLMVVAMAFFIVVMLVVVAMTFFIVMMLMVMAMTLLTVVMAVVKLKLFKVIFKGITFFYYIKNSLSVKVGPRGYDYLCLTIVLSEKVYTFVQFFLGKILCMAENNCTCMFNLVVEKLTEVLHIHFAFLCICNGTIAVKHNIITCNTVNCVDDVTQFAYSGWLYQNTVRRVFFDNFTQCL